MKTSQLLAGPEPLKYTPSASIDATVQVLPDGTTKSSARSEPNGKSVNVADKVALAPHIMKGYLGAAGARKRERSLPGQRRGRRCCCS